MVFGGKTFARKNMWGAVRIHDPPRSFASTKSLLSLFMSLGFFTPWLNFLLCTCFFGAMFRRPKRPLPYVIVRVLLEVREIKYWLCRYATNEIRWFLEVSAKRGADV